MGGTGGYCDQRATNTHLWQSTKTKGDAGQKKEGVPSEKDRALWNESMRFDQEKLKMGKRRGGTEGVRAT